MKKVRFKRKVAVAGAGVVGGGVIQMLQSSPDVELATVLVRNKDKKRDGVPLEGVYLTTDFKDISNDKTIDTVVEAMGGDGVALELILACLESGKSVITANKLLLAKHPDLLAHDNLRYEAACAGGIPIVKSLRRDFADTIVGIEGILNGTTNFILSNMENLDTTYDAALDMARESGFAEADPTSDVDGFDAMYKLVILCRLGLGAVPDMDTIVRRGIRDVLPCDFKYASMIGCTIRLVSTCWRDNDGVHAYVMPALVPLISKFGKTAAAQNTIIVYSELLGHTVYSGEGAGRGPTANSVVADLYDIPNRRQPLKTLDDGAFRANFQQRFFVRFRVHDGLGIVAALGTICKEEEVSIDGILQYPYFEDPMAFAVTTDMTTYEQITRVVRRMEAEEWCVHAFLCTIHY